MLNQAPYEWTTDSIVRAVLNGPYCDTGHGMEPARPFGMFSLRNRFRLAWMVFKGEADALRWPLQNPKAY